MHKPLYFASITLNFINQNVIWKYYVTSAEEGVKEYSFTAGFGHLQIRSNNVNPFRGVLRCQAMWRAADGA